jgi:hypothetical protein
MGSSSGQEKKEEPHNTKKGRPNIHSQGTDLPYGFTTSDLKRGLAALPYADGNIASFHRHLNLKSPVKNYVSKVLRTLGFLEGGNLADLGQQYVNSTEAKRPQIVAQAILKYPAYATVLKACDVDTSLHGSVSLTWVTQKLATDKHVSKTIAPRAAQAFAALVTEAGLGTVSGEGRGRAIQWSHSPAEILAGQDPARVVQQPRGLNLDAQTDDRGVPAKREEVLPPDGAPKEREQNHTFISQNNVGVFAFKPAVLGTSADMTTWTESQIRTYWDGHNRGLELALQIAKASGGQG